MANCMYSPQYFNFTYVLFGQAWWKFSQKADEINIRSKSKEMVPGQLLLPVQALICIVEMSDRNLGPDTE